MTREERKAILQAKLDYVKVSLQTPAADPERYPKEYLAFKTNAILPSLEAAMERISPGIQEVCADCGKTIPDGRLARAVGTLRCVSCQSKIERNGKRTPLHESTAGR